MSQNDIPSEVIDYFGIIKHRKLVTRFSDDIWIIRSYRRDHHTDSLFFIKDICPFVPEWAGNILYKDHNTPSGYHMLLSIYDRDYIIKDSKL